MRIGTTTADPCLSRSRGNGLTSALFLLEAVNPRILALTRCRIGPATSPFFSMVLWQVADARSLTAGGSNEGSAFCVLKYRLIAPGFYHRFCQLTADVDPLLERFRNFRSSSAPFFRAGSYVEAAAAVANEYNKGAKLVSRWNLNVE